MALPSVTRKRLLLSVLGIMIAGAAYAEYPVIDVTAIGKAMDQIKELKKQYQAELDQLQELKQSVSFLDDISGFMSDVKQATGAVGSLSLPIPNLQKIKAQTKSNFRCLMPDTSLKWGLKFEDLNLGSICETSNKYREALFFDPQAEKGASFAQQAQKRREVGMHRTALLEDSAARALAQADVQMKQADELNDAADQLQTDLAAAQTLQDREHVQAQIGVARLRGQAQQIQLLAQLLKVQTALAVSIGLPKEKVAEITKEGADQ